MESDFDYLKIAKFEVLLNNIQSSVTKPLPTVPKQAESRGP